MLKLKLKFSSFYFMKIIHIELPYKGGELRVLEISGQDSFGKLPLVLYNKRPSRICPMDQIIGIITSL